MFKFRDYNVHQVQILESDTKDELCHQISIIGSSYELIDVQFSVTPAGVRRKKNYHALLLIGAAHGSRPAPTPRPSGGDS
jgi:hypothetical protein